MKKNNQMNKVLSMQNTAQRNNSSSTTSNLSVVCKEQSTISFFACLPPVKP
ncbi:class III lanthipeptide [Staphylococcus pseudintermedius]|nr:class III lanthipeptide [Staphylococcus pseudintermedius]